MLTRACLFVRDRVQPALSWRASMWMTVQVCDRWRCVWCGNLTRAADAAGTASQRFTELATGEPATVVLRGRIDMRRAALGDPASLESYRAATLGIPVLRTDPAITCTCRLVALCVRVCVTDTGR